MGRLLMVRKRPIVTCRECGDWGYEDADDPCPGLCPPCFDKAMYGHLEAQMVDRWDRGLTITECLRLADERFAAMGCTPAMREYSRQKAEVELAEELAAERRGN